MKNRKRTRQLRNNKISSNRYGISSLLTLIIFIIFPVSTSAQGNEYFVLNETYNSVFYNRTISTWGNSSAVTEKYIEMKVMDDTVVGGQKYYALTKSMFGPLAGGPTGYYRMGEDNKLYLLGGAGDQLFLDLSDTSQTTFYGFTTHTSGALQISRRQSIPGQELEFSFGYTPYYDRVKLYFQKGKGFTARDHYTPSALSSFTSTYSIREIFTVRGPGDTLRYTQNAPTHFLQRKLDRITDSSFLVQLVIRHPYSPFIAANLTRHIYTDKLWVDYRYFIPGDTSATRTLEFTEPKDTLEVHIPVDSAYTRRGYSLQYKFRAKTREPNSRSNGFPANGSWLAESYKNPDTAFVMLPRQSSISYKKYRIRPGIDTVAAGLETLTITGDTMVSGTLYRQYYLGGQKYFVQYSITGAVARYFMYTGTGMVEVGLDSLQKFVQNTGSFWRMPGTGLSFVTDSVSKAFGVLGDIRVYTSQTGREYLKTLRGVGPVEYQYRDPAATGEVYVYNKVYKIMVDSVVVYSKDQNKISPLSVLPAGLKVYQNFPNPVSSGSRNQLGETVIRFYSPDEGEAELTIFTGIGERVYQQKTRVVAASENQFIIGDLDLPSGVYIYRITVGDKTQTKKMLVVR